ncbi:hypothetical protein GGI25_000045, partial [Coemansia spiralis]
SLSMSSPTSFVVHKTGGEFKFDHDSPEFRRLSLAQPIDPSFVESSAPGNAGSAAAANKSMPNPSHFSSELQRSASLMVSGTPAASMQQQASLQSPQTTTEAATANGNPVSSSSSSPLQALSTPAPTSAGAGAPLSGMSAAPPLYITSSQNNNNSNNYQLHSQMYAPSGTSTSSASGPVQLWMGDIEPWMDDERVRQIWALVGESVAVKMIRDRMTGGPANYCFIEVPTQADAERILGFYNGKPMPLSFDRPFRLNWATSMSAGYSGSSMLPSGPTLGSAVMQQGQLHSSALDGTNVDSNNSGVNTGTVSASASGASYTSVAAVISTTTTPTPAMNNSISSTTLSQLPSGDNPEYSLFVGDLAAEVTDTQLVHEFRCRYPSVRAAKVVTDPVTLLPRGYGFVRFGDEADQQRALIEMQGRLIGSRTIRVSTATPKRTPSMISSTHYHNQHQQQHQHGSAPGRDATGSPASTVSSTDSNAQYNPATDPFNTTVFVGGLTNPVGEDELYAFFSVYGEVGYCKIPPNRGCGFVTFTKRANAETAMRALNGHLLGGSRVRLSWGRSQSHARHNHRHHHHSLHQNYHRHHNSNGGSSSGANSHRNSVSEQHNIMNRRSVSFGKGTTSAIANPTVAALGLGLSGASVTSIMSSTPTAAPMSNTPSAKQNVAQIEAADMKSALPPGMAAIHSTHSASLQTPIPSLTAMAQPSPGLVNGNYFGGIALAQQQQLQQQQQQQLLNGYNAAPHSAFHTLSPTNQQGAVYGIDALGIEGGLGASDTSRSNIPTTPLAHPHVGGGGYLQQPHGGYYQYQQHQQPEQTMLTTPTTAHTYGLGDSPLLPAHFSRQQQQQQQISQHAQQNMPSLRNSGQFDNLYIVQQSHQQQQQNAYLQQECRDPVAFGSGTVLPNLAACPSDLLTRRLSALNLGAAATRSRPSSLVDGQPPILGASATFSPGSTGGIGGNITPTGNNISNQQQHYQQQQYQQQQQQQQLTPLLDRRPSVGVIGQRRLSSKPSFQHQLQPQRSLSQLSITQLWQSTAGSGTNTTNDYSFGTPSVSQLADCIGPLSTPASSIRPSSSSLSLLALSPSMGGGAAAPAASNIFSERIGADDSSRQRLNF